MKKKWRKQEHDESKLGEESAKVRANISTFLMDWISGAIIATICLIMVNMSMGMFTTSSKDHHYHKTTSSTCVNVTGDSSL